MLHLETVAPATLKLAQRILSLPELAGVRLVGGTALALQFGHRTSVDLDLFGDWDLQQPLDVILSPCGALDNHGGGGRMRFFAIDGVKLDCVNYPYPWLDKPVCEEGLRLASVRDIAAMKLSAVTNRGTRKDFVDVAFLLKRYDFPKLMSLYLQKYSDANEYTVLRSMTYFDDAEKLPLPTMLVPFDWEEAKATILEAVRAYAR